MFPRIAITPGEPAGIGPELVVKLAQQPQAGELVVFASEALLQQTAKQLHLPLTLIPVDFTSAPEKHFPGSLKIFPLPLTHIPHPGHPITQSAEYVLSSLTHAAHACLNQECDALVTGPVHKGIINDAGIPFRGHTEFFAEISNIDQVVMLLTAGSLRIALATTHLPLSEVPAAITKTNLEKTIRILHAGLKNQFRIPHPHIAICGLNPHAGEQGHLGREEISTIMPVIQTLQAQQFHLTGPLPADTIFTPKHLQSVDAVLAMYHDQGLPVLKFHGFGKAVNMTLGLPFIRTSVDHGTAFDIAGKSIADPSSFQEAIHMAITLQPAGIYV